MRSLAAGCLILLNLSFAAKLIAQKDQPAPAETPFRPEVPSRQIDLSHSEALTGLLDNSVLYRASGCSSQGVIYSNVRTVTLAGSQIQVAEVYAANDQRQVTKFDLNFPTGYGRVSARQLYPSGHRLLVLLQASQPLDPGVNLPPNQMVPFLSTLDLDTGEKNVIPLSLDFQVVKAAIFDSGKLLVVGMDPVNKVPVLALLREDGTLQQKLELDADDLKAEPPRLRAEERRPAQDGSGAAKATAAAVETVPVSGIDRSNRVPQQIDPVQRQLSRMLNSAQLVPWGGAILLVESGPKPRIDKVRDSGEHDAVKIELPEGARLTRVLGSSEKDTWVVAATSGGFRPGVERRAAEPVKDRFFEVDPFTGTINDELTVTGPTAAQVTCAANGRLAAVYLGATDQASGQQVLGYASAPR
jgi:hypothetical protein